jgi:RNA polymerase sigma factor (sigma-70 family)
VAHQAAGLTQLTDSEIVGLCRRGAEAGFSALLSAHHDYVLRLCWRILGQREEAMDVTQEVFLRATQSMSRLDPQPSLRPWLRRVATNLCINAASRSGRSQATGRSVSLEELAEPALPGSDGGQDPVMTAVAARADLDRVRTGIHLLSPEQRAVLLLRVVEGLGHHEIGQILDCPVGTVKSHLARARGRLRMILNSPKAGDAS